MFGAFSRHETLSAPPSPPPRSPSPVWYCLLQISCQGLGAVNVFLCTWWYSLVLGTRGCGPFQGGLPPLCCGSSIHHQTLTSDEAGHGATQEDDCIRYLLYITIMKRSHSESFLVRKPEERNLLPPTKCKQITPNHKQIPTVCTH